MTNREKLEQLYRAEGSSYLISLVKVSAQTIRDVLGYISKETGEPVFKLRSLLLADGTLVDIEGEHDFPYLGHLPGDLGEAMEKLYHADEMDEEAEEEPAADLPYLLPLDWSDLAAVNLHLATLSKQITEEGVHQKTTQERAILLFQVNRINRAASEALMPNPDPAWFTVVEETVRLSTIILESQ